MDHDLEKTELILDFETDVEKRKVGMRKATSAWELRASSSDRSKL